MKKKLFENIGGNQFKLNESGVSNVVADIEAQKGMYQAFELGYSEGTTFSNNLLALYGVSKGRITWLTSFDNYGEPMTKDEIVQVLTQTGLQKLVKDIPTNYSSEQGFQGSHA